MPGSGARVVLDEYVARGQVDGRANFRCTICGRANVKKNNIINHIESVHFPNSFTYNCSLCDKQFNSKNSLNVHVSTKHRNPNK